MADIVLTTFNAKYAHASLGLRCLRASLGELRDRSVIREAICGDKPVDVVERVLAESPRIVGIGVYVWNAVASRELVRLLKQVAPDVVVVVGGPEVSHETELQAITADADYVVTGEGEQAFAALCAQVLAGERPSAKVHNGGLPDLASLPLPYDEYTDEDLAHRVIYVEASRGCPFTCEFCLSSLDEKVRNVPLERFLPAMQRLFERGVRQFKFIDRTFNLKVPTSTAILEFFLERYTPELFVHFEMVPDRLPDALRSAIAKFPAGALQFEVGIQTFDPTTSGLISRRQDLAKLADNFAYLRAHTGVHIHADLIVGLPGETVESFARGFDRLVALDPHEIQVGILKRLRGTPIVRHTGPYAMLYSGEPPYEVLSTSAIDFATMQRMKRFAKVWEVVGNSGQFGEARSLFWQPRPEAAPAPAPHAASSHTASSQSPRAGAPHAASSSQSAHAAVPHSATSQDAAATSHSVSPQDANAAESHSISQDAAAAENSRGHASPFAGIMAFADFVYAKAGKTHSISLERWFLMAFEHLTEHCVLPKTEIAEILHTSYTRSGRKKLRALSDEIGAREVAKDAANRGRGIPRRQALHLS